MAEKKSSTQKKETSKSDNGNIKKVASKTNAGKSGSKKTTTSSKNGSNTSKKTTSKSNGTQKLNSTPKKASPRSNTNKKSVNSKTTSSTKTNTSKSVSKTSSKEKAKISSSKPKEVVGVKKSTTKKNSKPLETIKKENKTSLEKNNKNKETKEVKKKIVSTKKVVGKEVLPKKKQKEILSENNKNKKEISFLIISKKIGLNAKKIGNTIVIKTKSFFVTISNAFQQFLQNKKPKEKVKLEKKSSIKSKDIPLEVKEKKKGNLKKRSRRFLIVLSILCLFLAILLMIPYGTTTYRSDASGKILDIPKMSIIKEECCNYNATFSTFRSVNSLKKDVEGILNQYERLNCDNQIYYYNSKENYTITNYTIHRGVFINEMNISYGVGNSCNIDTKFKKLELLADDFSIQDAKKDGNYVIEGDKISNKSSYDEFMNNVKAKIPSTLRIVTTNKEGDVLITDLEYLSSGKYMVSYDGTRDRNAKNHRSIVAYKFDHLKVNKNKLYAYNGSKLVIKKAKKYETYYLLTLPKD